MNGTKYEFPHCGAFSTPIKSRAITAIMSKYFFIIKISVRGVIYIYVNVWSVLWPTRSFPIETNESKDSPSEWSNCFSDFHRQKYKCLRRQGKCAGQALIAQFLTHIYMDLSSIGLRNPPPKFWITLNAYSVVDASALLDPQSLIPVIPETLRTTGPHKLLRAGQLSPIFLPSLHPFSISFQTDFGKFNIG